MKFTMSCLGADAEHEFEIYSYLDAINNTEIEKYGIPCVYYYGEWEECQMIGMTLLNPEFNKRYAHLNVNDIDVLVLCREFVSNALFSFNNKQCLKSLKLKTFIDKDIKIHTQSWYLPQRHSLWKYHVSSGPSFHYW